MNDRAAKPLTAYGTRVRVSPAAANDIEPYRDAMTRSAARIGQWNPVNPGDLVHHLAAQSDKHRTFLIRADDANRRLDDSAGLVGCVNVTNVIQGRFMSATIGYNAFDPYVGTGLFGEGLKLVVDIALQQAPTGMGLHRVEANVRIGNTASTGVLRSLGFRRERTMRRMLWLADGVNGASAWRDHDSYAVTREDWPGQPYADHHAPSGVLVLDDTSNVPFAVSVARELGAVTLFDLPYDAALAVAANSAVPVIWCAEQRTEDAVRDLRSRGVHAVATCVDPTGGVDPRAVTRAALALRPMLR